MEQIILDGAQMTSPMAAQRYLAEALHAPDYYGENLDALYDVLTSITQDTTIVLLNGELAQQQLGDYAEKLFCVMEDASAENDNLMLELA